MKGVKWTNIKMVRSGAIKANLGEGDTVVNEFKLQ